MDSDHGKLFIGGISWETNEETLKEYFQGYGEVLRAVVMRDKISGRPRGFGFVVFADPATLDNVLQDRHVIDGRTVDVKRALSREEQVSRTGSAGSARNTEDVRTIRTKKIFVGGLPPTLTEEDFRQYFESYGTVSDVIIMYDQQTNRPRGFGFVSFDSEDAVDRVLHKNFHDLFGKQVEVKRALPKDANPGGAGRSGGGGALGYSGGYPGYGSSFTDSGPYDRRMEPNRYMQSQNTGGGNPSYGISGYNALSYGYGPNNNGMSGYGYGNYGPANPGYGGPAGGGYGNVPNAGYGAPPNAQRNSWGAPPNAQTPPGYGYGSSQWGGPSSGGGPTRGGPAPSQSPSGLSGYRNQSYGYGGYSGNDGAYGHQAAYGGGGMHGGIGPNGSTPSGDPHSGNGSYVGGGYGDGSGNPGYGNSSWQSDPSQGSANYGGSYGGLPDRQP